MLMKKLNWISTIITLASPITLNNIHQVLSMEEILFLQNETEKVYSSSRDCNSRSKHCLGHPPAQRYLLGASTRSGITFLKCLKAFALVNGRTFVTEDDLQQITSAVLDHRLIYRNRDAKAKALASILDKEMDRLSKLKIAG